MNNDIDSTYYTLSIRELMDMCRDYFENQESDEPDKALSSFVECYVKYIMDSRKDISDKYIDRLIKLCRDFSFDCYDGFVSNDGAYIKAWLIKNK